MNSADIEDIKAAKKTLRKKIQSSAVHGDSDKAQELFLESDLYKKASCVMCFISAENEINTARIIAKCLVDEKTVAVPRCGAKPGIMDFYVLENLPLSRQTEKGAFGLTEPLKSLKRMRAFFIPKNTVIVVPGLAFTRNGKRLGHGMGYYDRYIAGLIQKSRHFRDSGKTVGFAYDSQILKDLPVEETDRIMNYIITDKEIISIS